MNGQSTRLVKEARQLLAPWCGLTLAGLIALAPGPAPHHGVSRLIEFIVPFGIFIGIPLLATLAIGYDFQWRTLPLLLSQPVERATIWREKIVVSVIAILPLVAVYLYGVSSGRVVDREMLPIAVPWLLVTIASAMFWTLVARSTIGGLALNTTAAWVVFYAIYLATWRQGEPAIWRPFELDRIVIVLSYAVVCAYSALMVWLGRRRFLRLQAAEGMPGDDFLAEIGSKIVPRAVGDWFRCRPGSPVLNLIRRELHLLRPVWLLTILSALAWTNLLGFHLMPARAGGVARPTSSAAVIAIGIAASLIPLIAVLAGVLSLGEEKTLGTHDWHMTLPLSPRSQWLLKLTVAIVVSAVCGGLVPVAVLAIAGIIGGSVFTYLEPPILWLWPLAASAVTVVAFWCACVVKGTIRSVLWVFPVFFVFGLTANVSEWMAETLLPRINGSIDAAVMWLDPFRMTRSLTAWDLIAIWLPVWLFAPAILFLVLQSYRQFRAQAQDTNRHLATCLLPVAGVVFVCSFALWGSVHVLNRAQHQKEMVFREMHNAIQQARQHRSNQADSHAMRLTVAELASTSPLSAETRHWVGDATITVTPERPHTVAWCCGMFYPVQAKSGLEGSSYVAVMPLTNGSSCTMTFQSFGTKYGTLGGMCN